jgi:hypothetical protein
MGTMLVFERRNRPMLRNEIAIHPTTKKTPAILVNGLAAIGKGPAAVEEDADENRQRIPQRRGKPNSGVIGSRRHRWETFRNDHLERRRGRVRGPQLVRGLLGDLDVSAIPRAPDHPVSSSLDVPTTREDRWDRDAIVRGSWDCQDSEC